MFTTYKRRLKHGDGLSSRRTPTEGSGNSSSKMCSESQEKVSKVQIMNNKNFC